MASIREHHGKYQARYYDPTGRQRTKSFARKSDARAFLAAVETDKRRGEWIDPRLAAVPFDDWAWQHFESKHNLRASTRATDRSFLTNHVIPAFTRSPIGRITPLDVQGWINGLVEQRLAPKTVKHCYRVFAGIMASAVEARLIVESPCHAIALPRIPRTEQRFLAADEVERLAASVGPMHAPLVYSAVYLGCRWGELVGLKREHLDLLRRKAHIVGTLEEVGGKVRWVPETKTNSSRRSLSIPPFLCDLLARHLRDAPETEFVFSTATGAPLRRSSFREAIWLPAVSRAGLGPLRFHDLRHTFAALLIANGAHSKEVQVRLGHSSITTTMNVYGHLLPSLDEQLTSGLERTYREARREANVDQMWTKAPAEVVALPVASSAHTL